VILVAKHYGYTLEEIGRLAEPQLDALVAGLVWLKEVELKGA